MRIADILSWHNHFTERNRVDPAAPSSDDLTNLANAFTRHGVLKHLWNLHGSEGHSSGAAPPDVGNELIPSGTVEPTTASWPAEPVEANAR